MEKSSCFSCPAPDPLVVPSVTHSMEWSSDERTPPRFVGIHEAGKRDELLLTYKRRPRTGGQKRKDPEDTDSGSPVNVRDELRTPESRTQISGLRRKNTEDRELESPENVREEEPGMANAIDQASYNTEKECGSPAKEVEGVGRGETLSTIKTWKTVIGQQKTFAPKRIVGQYFLDLGQADFSYSTCPVCGLFYARGHENDEKVHKTFHRNSTQGIVFKGWQSERVASKLDDKGNRVIVVLADDTHRQPKVREVIEVMELELGLTAGWLHQRSCKVYLFISASKKIVGCLMAEPIKSAFRVVPAPFQNPGKGGERSQCDAEEKTGPGRAPDESCSQSEKNVMELPATQMDQGDSREQSSIGDKEPTPSLSSKDPISTRSSSSMSVSAVTGNSPESNPKVKKVLQHTVKHESVSIRDRMRTPKITDYFALKTRPEGSQAGCKSEWDVSDTKPDVEDLLLKIDKDEKSEQGILSTGQDTKPDVKGRHLDIRKDEKSEQNILDMGQDTKPDATGLHLKIERSERNIIATGQDQKPNCVQPENEEKFLRSHISEVAYDEGKPSASVSRQAGVQDGDCRDEESREGRKHRNNIMIFGNIKFFRETLSRKQAKKERTQDLGSAILYTKTSVPAVCGVRVIWVSQTERRKGIATHLLDAMRKTFCLGVVLEPSQFAFSQPTPEGRKFAVRYCKTEEFLVYTTS